MMNLDGLEMTYEPFPIGIAREVFPAALYEELVSTYPPPETFTDADSIGYKYTLSEKYNARAYAAWIRDHEPWRRFHASVDFW